ncbi:MAG: N-acetylglucosamine-6-phosphate deacetylase [Cytophagaceae bacterium]|nr:N-acetylglucosamine-6-phosphate deacetylase [Cytophagaceae bacterium]
MPYALTNARFFTGDEWLTNTAVLVEGDTVFALTNHFAEDVQHIDLHGLTVAPAFIDLQIYGAGGYLFNSQPTPEAIGQTYAAIRQTGTLHFQITLSSVPMETVWTAIEATKKYLAENGTGLLGLHLEGPYFNPIKRGAHKAGYLRTPEMDELRRIVEQGRGAVTYLTAAPELFKEEQLALLLASEIYFSAGHSNATYAQAQRAFGQGVGRVTHLYNAMSPFQHRAPGLVGAAFDSPASASIIADGVHCDWAAVRIAKQMMGERLFFITDAVTEDLSGEYQFRLAGDHFTDENGVLSGSALTMMQAVQNAVQHAGIELGEALRMASTYPARVMNLDQRLGRIAPGFAASLVLFDDDYRVQGIVENGRLAWLA